MTWSHPTDTWIVIIGALCAAACALPGSWLVLRRMSMMGDAISHAVLPGLALAWLLTGERTSMVMFAGAAIVGVLTAVFTQWVHAFGRVDRGAAMGVVFTTLFAIGLILIVRGAERVDLDPGCVLYGSLELAPLDQIALGPWLVPRAALVLAAVLALNAAVITLFYKELKISAFDPALATSLGISARAMHYLLMTLVAITTVASFEVIGSILVIAMLIVPAAAAHLLTDRLRPMIVVSVVIAIASAVLGHGAAIVVPGLLGFDSTISSGMMAVAAGALFAVALLAAPRHGVVSRLVERERLRLRIAAEDIAALLYRLEEARADERRASGGPAGPDAGAEALTAPAALLLERLSVGGTIGRLALRHLQRTGRVVRAAGGFALTAAGRAEAADLVRSHRLWESFLHEHLPLPADHVHPTAERLEHVTSRRMQRDLARATKSPRRDPHGKEIPDQRRDP